MNAAQALAEIFGTPEGWQRTQSTRLPRRTCFHCGHRRNAVLLQPVDGLDGEFECVYLRGCERRIKGAS